MSLEMDTRTIDVAKTASIDMMSLNNKVVKMRPVIKRSKAQIVNRLCRHISALKKKKGTEAQKEKNIRKAERLIEEIESIRRLKEDKVSKYSLANTTTFESISKSTLSPNMRALARLADHHLVKEVVSDFRQKHNDWRDLAAFLLIKQTGRKFKTKKQKQKKLAQRVENINASETMTKAYIEERFGKEGLEKAEQRFQKKRKKGKGVKVDSQETHLPEVKNTQDTVKTSQDRVDMQTDNTTSPDVKTEETVSESGNQSEDFTSFKKGAEGNIGEEFTAGVVENEKETVTTLGCKNTLIVNSSKDEEMAQELQSKLGRGEKEVDNDEDDSSDGETEDEYEESNKKEDGDAEEEDQASIESEDNVDTDDSNETEESNIMEERDEDDESVEEKRPEVDASTTSARPKIQSEKKSVKSGECVVKKLKIGVSTDESDDQGEEDDDETSEEDSDDTGMEEESNSLSSKSASSEQDESDIESHLPHKKRKAQKEDKYKKGKLVPEFLTKRDQVLKNTPNDPFFVGSDGEEGDDDEDVLRHPEMDFDVNDDYFDGRGSGSGKGTSKSMFYEPGGENMSGRWFEKKDFSSGFKSRGRGRFDNRGRGRSFGRSRGDFRGRGRGGYFNSSNRGRGREFKDDDERKTFKFGSSGSRGEKGVAFSRHGSTQRGRGDKQISSQRFGSSSSKDPGPSTGTDKLHPSWEASRKRKAEQSGLKAFEGTKIVFDDD